jgi:hypothetical protein
MQDRVIELARHLQRPEIRALRSQPATSRRIAFRRLDRDGGDASARLRSTLTKP